MQVELGDLEELGLADFEVDFVQDLTEEEEENTGQATDEEEEEEYEEDEDYAAPIGPLPQMITNDLKSLDEMVRVL